MIYLKIFDFLGYLIGSHCLKFKRYERTWKEKDFPSAPSLDTHFLYAYTTDATSFLEKFFIAFTEKCVYTYIYLPPL